MLDEAFHDQKACSIEQHQDIVVESNHLTRNIHDTENREMSAEESNEPSIVHVKLFCRASGEGLIALHLTEEMATL